MFNNDVQTPSTNNWKRNNNEHPIDRILTAYFHTNKQIRNSQSNTRSNNDKSETSHIMQRQRVIRSFLNKPDETESSIQKPPTCAIKSKTLPTTSISSPHLLFAELNEQSTNNNNNNRSQTIKKELERQSPILIRHNRSTIEHASPIQLKSDVANVSGHNLLLTIPPNFIFRNKVSQAFVSDRSSLKINNRIATPHIKSLNYSKTISENTLKPIILNSKLIHQNNFLPMHKWTPKFPEQGLIHNRTVNNIYHPKSYLPRYFIKRHCHSLQSERINTNTKINNIQNLYISPRSLNNPHNESEIKKKQRQKKLIVDEWDDSKWSHSGISDEDESISVDGNSSTSTCTSQISVQQYDNTLSSIAGLSDQHETFLSSNLSVDSSKSKTQRPPTKRSISRRRTYNIALPPVAEHINDEETESINNIHTDDMKKILEKLYALQNNNFNEKNFERSIDDEHSLTFQLLNQQETEFEKQLSKFKKSRI
ncbi:unnamed protein product [Rotaria sordida]|uniref:Uncharacterized protein n=1 Tax=Rotaria sordida TaxID=392033 RepID=A0A813TQP4_9BILA|nr:unnamed protein product [Rotaria sordida]